MINGEVVKLLSPSFVDAVESNIVEANANGIVLRCGCLYSCNVIRYPRLLMLGANNADLWERLFRDVHYFCATNHLPDTHVGVVGVNRFWGEAIYNLWV